MIFPGLRSGEGEHMIATLSPLVAGRSIALVGNARSLAASGHGQEIDACGLVIRLNAAPGCSPHSHGTRTDWLAASTLPPLRRLRELRPQRLFWMSPRHRAAAALGYGWRLPTSFYPRGWWRALAAGLGSRPSTGMMAIDLLLRTGGFQELRLFGFDFFASGSLSDRRLAGPAPHDFARERAHVESLAARGAAVRIVGAPEP